MDKFKLPQPPIFSIKSPPIPPIESSTSTTSFVFTIDYLFEMTKNRNKCLNLVDNKRLVVDSYSNENDKINFFLVIFTVFLIILIIIFIILIVNCLVKFNFIKLFKKIFSKLDRIFR